MNPRSSEGLLPSWYECHTRKRWPVDAKNCVVPLKIAVLMLVALVVIRMPPMARGDELHRKEDDSAINEHLKKPRQDQTMSHYSLTNTTYLPLVSV